MEHRFADSLPHADFLATQPPGPHEVAHLAQLMASLGATLVRAVIFDLETKQCHEGWEINEDGESSGHTGEGGAFANFVTAMGTIAQLSQAPASESLVRQLNPRRYAFAWRIDERQVAVAEVRYHLPQAGRRDQDAAILREIFTAHLQGHAVVGHVNLDEAAHQPLMTDAVDTGPAYRDDAASQDLQRLDESQARRSGVHAGKGVNAVNDIRGLRGQHAGLGALIAFCVLAAAMFMYSRDRVQLIQVAQLQLQTQVDATLGRQLADVLAQGDYGEVQAELETFAGLGYFQDAVVTNAQRRVIALVGTVDDARVGNVFPSTAAGTAKVLALRDLDDSALGQALLWTSSDPTPGVATRLQALLGIAALLSVAAMGVAGWVLLRIRRAGSP